jgi:hypothetical protein
LKRIGHTADFFMVAFSSRLGARLRHKNKKKQQGYSMPKAGPSVSLSENWRRQVPPAHIIDRARQQPAEQPVQVPLHIRRPEDYAGYEDWARQQA